MQAHHYAVRPSQQTPYDRRISLGTTTPSAKQINAQQSIHIAAQWRNATLLGECRKTLEFTAIVSRYSLKNLSKVLRTVFLTKYFQRSHNRLRIFTRNLNCNVELSGFLEQSKNDRCFPPSVSNHSIYFPMATLNAF